MSAITEQEIRSSVKNKAHKESKAGLAAYFFITSDWGLSSAEQRKLLGNPAPESFAKWKTNNKGLLNQENKERILQVLRIYRGLDSLYSKPNVKVWLTHKNKNVLFNNRSPLEHMLTGRLSALTDVKNYLDWAQA